MSETLMFDFSHFYERIAKELPDNCVVAELGIADCDSVIFLAKELLKTGKKFKIYGIDNFDYGGFIQMKHCYQNLIKAGVAEYVEIIPKPSLEAADDFNNGYLHMVFIDSSHTYPETKYEIVKWYDKVLDEGIISGHDFNAEEVQKSVLEVVPKQFLRTDILDRNFDVEKVLHTEDTTNGWGVWWFRKQFYLRLNNVK